MTLVDILLAHVRAGDVFRFKTGKFPDAADYNAKIAERDAFARHMTEHGFTCQVAHSATSYNEFRTYTCEITSTPG